jgi:ubiquinone/menaquinone biosynthesis C-methylase UbiE
MLYHVPDREQAVSDTCRVLKPGGHFYAATNGQAHVRELYELTDS